MRNILFIILISFCSTTFGQNGASTPGVADNNAISLPYHKSGHSTSGNNVQDPGGIVNAYTSGKLLLDRQLMT